MFMIHTEIRFLLRTSLLLSWSSGSRDRASSTRSLLMFFRTATTLRLAVSKSSEYVTVGSASSYSCAVVHRVGRADSLGTGVRARYEHRTPRRRSAKRRAAAVASGPNVTGTRPNGEAHGLWAFLRGQEEEPTARVQSQAAGSVVLCDGGLRDGKVAATHSGRMDCARVFGIIHGPGWA